MRSTGGMAMIKCGRKRNLWRHCSGMQQRSSKSSVGHRSVLADEPNDERRASRTTNGTCNKQRYALTSDRKIRYIHTCEKRQTRVTSALGHEEIYMVR